MSVRGRLSISAALSRNTSLDSSYRSDSTSASVTQAEREIKKLKEENAKLRKEIKDVRSLYNQLVQENSHEKFDERRIMFIKSQVIQLERQLLLMSEALSSRSETLIEVENSLAWMADQWRLYISQDNRSPEVPVKRSDLIVMVETAESARIKLYKNIENSTVRNLTRPLMFLNKFVKPGYEEEITLLDIASGELDHLNLKHVSNLETKLASLYKELISFHSLIEDSDQSSLHPVSHHKNLAIQDRITTKLLKSCAMIKDCCGDLVQLSLLYPSAPWPPLKKSTLKDLTCDKVMKSLPQLPKSKIREVQSVIEAVFKAVNYKNCMLNHEIKSLKEDLKFHKSVYELQLEYIQALFEAVKDGYKKFEESTRDIIIEPLKDVLKTYDVLKSSASEKALKEFLSSFKQNSEKLENTVQQLSASDDEDNRSEALTKFGEDFFCSLDKLVVKCQRNRDKAVRQRSDLKEEQERLEQELRNLLDEQELKYKEHFFETTGNKSDIDDSRTSYKKSPSKDCNLLQTQHTFSFISKSETENSDEKNICNEEKNTERRKNVNQSENDINSTIDERTNVKNRKKWNDDVSCPPEFDKLEFIYKEDIQKFDSDTDTIIPGIHNISCTSDEAISLENQNSSDVLPPVGQTKQHKKKKPKRNYTPNLVVPNRTLELRRSESLSRMSESSERFPQADEQEKLDTDGSTNKIKLSRSRSNSKERKLSNIPQKPPFR